MSERRTEVVLDCVYRRVWPDGYGARGWKLAVADGDPEIIASTAAAGDRIPTSVFVHDVLDHALCGLGSSGHRNEAVALQQLASRTGTDPTPDFAQMVDEDLLHGRAVGGGLLDFLPSGLAAQVPPGPRGEEGHIIGFLEDRLGRGTLRKLLISRFHEIGRAGAAAAQRHYAGLGLDYRRRAALGLALQALLEQADALARGRGWGSAEGSVRISGQRCGFSISTPVSWSAETGY